MLQQKVDLLLADPWISLSNLILTCILSLHVPFCHIFCTWHQTSTNILFEASLSFYSVHMVENIIILHVHVASSWNFLLSHTEHILWTLLLPSFAFVLVLAMHLSILPRKYSTILLFLLMMKFFIHISEAQKPKNFAQFFHQEYHYQVFSAC